MVNATTKKFGYPESLIKEYDHWLLLLRPAQVTLGSLVLAAKSDATAYADLPPEAFAEQHKIVGEIESAMGSFVRPAKMNYLMLMMVDPHVHFHIFARYEGVRTFQESDFPDHGWPGPPDLGSAVSPSSDQVRKLKSAISSNLC